MVNLIKKHKLISIAVLILLFFATFFCYKNFQKKDTQVSYVLSTVEKGSVIVSVSGAGQVSDLDEATVKSEVSADVIYSSIKKGDNVAKGQLLLKLDPQKAKEAIETAQDNFDAAQLALAKINGYDIAAGHIRGTSEKAKTTLNTAYEDGFNAVETAFLNLPTLMSDFYSVLYSNDFSTYQKNIDYYLGTIGSADEAAMAYRDEVYKKYQTAKNLYDQNFKDYKNTSRYSDADQIESLINQSYETIKAISDAAKSANNFIQYYQEKMKDKGIAPVTLSNTHLTSVQSYMSKTNTYLSSLLSVKNTIQSAKESLISIDSDIADQEKEIKKMQEALADAQDELQYYSTYAPVAGLVTALNVEKGDSVSSGANIITIATVEKVAEITLNEVDVANIKVGQKATLTFDAVEDLNITGTVSEVDVAGTVSQGVVSYGVIIALDTQDDRIKSGMTVTAFIVTQAKQDVLVVPNSAIKTSSGESYVEISADASKIELTKQKVTVGLSDDSNTEILSGLNEGDSIIVKTVNSSLKSSSFNPASSQSSGSIFKTVSGSSGNGQMRGPGF
jgi:HlyD family secretion protein